MARPLRELGHKFGKLVPAPSSAHVGELNQSSGAKSSAALFRLAPFRYPCGMAVSAQLDLFAAASPAPAGIAAGPRPEEELALIRRDLYPLLEEAERAARLPWSYTKATVVEIQMAGWAKWLPAEEAAAVTARFAAAMERLWALEPEAPEA
jgi:hypothetical protein